MKDAAKYATTLLIFIIVSFLLSWAAMYSYWFSAHLFHSVRAVRVCESISMGILAPVRVAFWCFGDLFDQSTPLSNPMWYVELNAVLLGSIVYFACRPWLFGRNQIRANGQD
jgi:hypothetical protein